MKLAHITPQLATEVLGNRFNNFSSLPASGTRGGIKLGWHSDFIVATNLMIRQYSLFMIFRPTWEISPFVLIVVYGPSEDYEKTEFLEELVSLTSSSQMQWIVLGDFNLIYEARDKNNLNLNRQLMGWFRQSLDMCELFEFALQNRKYTWSNERAQPTLVQLDRVFYNKDWDLMHSGFSLQALSSSLSDHSPLLLCRQDMPVIRESFRFENFWPRVPGFKDVVMGAWSELVLGISPMNILFFKLKRTAVRLRQWSKKLFGNARIELHMANEIIHRLDLA
jgi:hypothetical protein